MTPVKPMTPSSDVRIQVPPEFIAAKPVKPHRIPSQPWKSISDEDARMAVIEGQREKELLREAESEARRRRIARCEEEIRRLESQPANIPDRAYLVTMGVEDWRAEKKAIEAEGVRDV